MLMALAVWVGTQNFGGILTGSSTDVGTGPAWILLALAFWPAARTRIPAAGKPALAPAQDSSAVTGTDTTARSA